MIATKFINDIMAHIFKDSHNEPFQHLKSNFVFEILIKYSFIEFATDHYSCQKEPILNLGWLLNND